MCIGALFHVCFSVHACVWWKFNLIQSLFEEQQHTEEINKISKFVQPYIGTWQWQAT